MPDNERRQDHGIRTIEEFSSGLANDFRIVSQSNKDSASRLVWFVAISGFALVNMRSYAEAVSGTPLTRVQLSLISLPWALTAVSGVISHWLLGELIARDNEFHMLRQHAIRSFLANAQPKPSIHEILEILNVDDTDKDVAQRKRRVDALFPWVTWAERATFALLLLAFILSAVLPLVY
jgi:hypothetical protein